MQCEEWADANSELFKEAHDEAVHKNSYKRKLYELISASLTLPLLYPVVNHSSTYMYDGINIMVNQFPILLDAVAYLAGRKLFAKSFLFGLTL